MPLDGKTDIGEVARFANAVGTLFVSRDPDHLTQEFSKSRSRRADLFDTGRNGYSATFAAAYTVRAKAGAPVSAPVHVGGDRAGRGRVRARSRSETMPARNGGCRRSLVRYARTWAICLRGDGKISRPLAKRYDILE